MSSNRFKDENLAREVRHKFEFYVDWQNQNQNQDADSFHKVVQSANYHFFGIAKALPRRSVIEVVCRRPLAGQDIARSDRQRLDMLEQLKTAAGIDDNSNKLTFFSVSSAAIETGSSRRCRKLDIIDSYNGSLSNPMVGAPVDILLGFLNTPRIHELTGDSASVEWRQEIYDWDDEFIVAPANSIYSEEYFCQRVYSVSDSEELEVARQRTIKLLKEKAGNGAKIFSFDKSSLRTIKEVPNVNDSKENCPFRKYEELQTVKEFLLSKDNGGYSFPMIGDAEPYHPQARALHRVAGTHPNDGFIGIEYSSEEKSDVSAADNKAVIFQRFRIQAEWDSTTQNRIRDTMLGQLKNTADIRDNQCRRFLWISSIDSKGHRQLSLIDEASGTLVKIESADPTYAHFSMFLNMPPIHFLNNEESTESSCREWLEEMSKYQSEQFIVARLCSSPPSPASVLYCQRLDVSLLNEEYYQIAINCFGRWVGIEANFFLCKLNGNQALDTFWRINSLGFVTYLDRTQYETEVFESLQGKIQRAPSKIGAKGDTTFRNDEEPRVLVHNDQDQSTSCCSCLPVILELFCNKKTAVAAILFLASGGLGGVAFYLGASVTASTGMSIGSLIVGGAASFFMAAKSPIEETVPLLSVKSFDSPRSLSSKGN